MINFENTIASLRQTEALLLNATPLSISRFLIEKIDLDNRMIGIIGPRGVGKTTLMLQVIKKQCWKEKIDPDKVLYFSADSATLNDGDLLGLVKYFYLQQAGRVILIDEIHKFTNWQQELKNIYDSLPELKIIFSGSSSTSLIKGKYDLSRRAVTYVLPGLSFREYLSFQGLKINTLSFSEVTKNFKEISRDLSRINDILFHQGNYNRQGYYPYFVENTEHYSLKQKVLASIDKSIYEDISSQYKVDSTNLRYFRKILAFLSLISPGESSVNKISSAIGKNNVTVDQYLEMLSDAYLLRFLPSKSSANQSLKDKKKIFLDNNTQAGFLSESAGGKVNLGTQRELFVLSHLQNSGESPYYTQVGDLALKGYNLEIGGKAKDSSQLKGSKKGLIVSDDILVASQNKIPMYLFGMLY